MGARNQRDPFIAGHATQAREAIDGPDRMAPSIDERAGVSGVVQRAQHLAVVEAAPQQFALVRPLGAAPWECPAVQAWLLKHPRFNMHFTPTSASWLNMVERFFRDISENRLRRGVFTSVSELIAAIDEYIDQHNANPKPFIWTASARDILQKVIRANSRLSSKQNATLH